MLVPGAFGSAVLIEATSNCTCAPQAADATASPATQPILRVILIVAPFGVGRATPLRPSAAALDTILVWLVCRAAVRAEGSCFRALRLVSSPRKGPRPAFPPPLKIG